MKLILIIINFDNVSVALYILVNNSGRQLEQLL